MFPTLTWFTPMLRSALPVSVFFLAALFTATLSPVAHAGDGPLRFRLLDGGAPPWLYLMPGSDRPEGIVADILDTAARAAGRELHYEFQPRENIHDALSRGSADGALFFSVTRPPGRELLVSEPLAPVDIVFVTPRDKPVNYRGPSNLRDQRLCTLTEERYPPLGLLSIKGTLRQTRAKTEQAVLMMLRNESCVAAIINGPAYRWMESRYNWNDLRIEPKPLLREKLVLGFAARERDFADAVNRTVIAMRISGRLEQLVNRWLPDDAHNLARIELLRSTAGQRAPGDR